MKKASIFFLLTALFLGLTPVQAGHELPWYPSFYPQEIRIKTVNPISAADMLKNAAIHAYVGENPAFQGKTPSDVGYVESLKSYLVMTFNPDSRLSRDLEERIAAARQLVSTLAETKGAYIFHPYPVTPYHMDYLYHFDLVQESKKKYSLPSSAVRDRAGWTFKLDGKGDMPEKIIKALGQEKAKTWDATVEVVDIGDLVASQSIHMDGWEGPPWLHQGWFQAYLLLADKIGKRVTKLTVKAIYQHLLIGDYDSVETRINMERKLVSLLTRESERVVLGYTLRREYFNKEYSAGVENIAYDSQTGFNSAIFIRTVKLKDFPWNGWLRLGIESAPSAAWNPIGGFTDPAGRLIWLTLGDSAFFPAPYNGNWALNRIGDFR